MPGPRRTTDLLPTPEAARTGPYRSVLAMESRQESGRASPIAHGPNPRPVHLTMAPATLCLPSDHWRRSRAAHAIRALQFFPAADVEIDAVDRRG
ncbi:hypothetical protein BJF90_35370 [Pseudonocardia sp. CNS-004]|nr:hypothetical protein BJF90_35370 [Pseudonocardia sp. CNS-004]